MQKTQPVGEASVAYYCFGSKTRLGPEPWTNVKLVDVVIKPIERRILTVGRQEGDRYKEQKGN